MMSLENWYYYLSLEEDIINTSRYVHFSDKNLKVFSYEYMKIISLVSVEIESITKKFTNSGYLIDKIESLDYIIHDIELSVKRSHIKIKPFEKGQEGSNDSYLWKIANNQLKHHKEISLNCATLENALRAMGALFLLLIYSYNYNNNGNSFAISGKENEPKLFVPPLEGEDTGLRIVSYGQLWKTRLRRREVS